MLTSYRMGGGGLQDFSVSPSPLGLNWGSNPVEIGSGAGGLGTKGFGTRA